MRNNDNAFKMTFREVQLSDDGYEKGYDEGREVGYQDGYESGNEAGYAEGNKDGYQSGYEKGTQDGRKTGYDEGFEQGKTEGDTEGYTRGYGEGQTAGVQEGEKTGYDKGYSAGDTAGYNRGYAAGATEGYNRGKNDGADAYYALIARQVHGVLNIDNIGPYGQRIGMYAFASCNDLSEVRTNRPVVAVGERAFYKCANLRTATLNDIQAIEYEAFADCSNLKSVVLNTNVIMPNLVESFPNSNIDFGDGLIYVQDAVYNTYVSEFGNQRFPGSQRALGEVLRRMSEYRG